MDELYFFKPSLNKKKLIISIIILFLLGISAISGFMIYKNIKNVNIKTKTYLIDNNFNISIKDSHSLIQYETTDYFLLELHSENNLNFYIRKLENLDNYSLYMISKNDCLSFTTNFENVADISNINYSNINDFESCNYNFKYLDSSSNLIYFMQVNLVKIGNTIYSLTADFPVSSVDVFNPIVNDIVNSISVNNL